MDTGSDFITELEPPIVYYKLCNEEMPSAAAWAIDAAPFIMSLGDSNTPSGASLIVPGYYSEEYMSTWIIENGQRRMQDEVQMLIHRQMFLTTKCKVNINHCMLLSDGWMKTMIIVSVGKKCKDYYDKNDKCCNIDILDGYLTLDILIPYDSFLDKTDRL